MAIFRIPVVLLAMCKLLFVYAHFCQNCSPFVTKKTLYFSSVNVNKASKCKQSASFMGESNILI